MEMDVKCSRYFTCNFKMDENGNISENFELHKMECNLSCTFVCDATTTCYTLLHNFC
jgi:hypothetical protein